MANRIRDAIELLARKGWVKGQFTDETGGHCLQGALYEAHSCQPRTLGHLGGGMDGGLAADLRLVNEVIAAEYPDRVGAVGISRFNDHPDTTVDDVLRVLEKSAVRRDEAV
ncbi:MAG: DUF6197 family protein [Acidimicrobiales bacterium]